MRANVPAYEMVTPRNLEDALARLPEWEPFAGGTDLMVLFEAGRLEPSRFINIWPLEELRGIEVSVDAVTLGALTTYTEVQRHPILRREFPMLCQAAAETGGIAIQNRGTLGGNIANASPAADSPPVLLAYGAEIELTSIQGSRWIPYDRFHAGYKLMDLQSSELLTRIRLPRDGGEGVHYYRKVGTRKAQAISKVCFAGYARKNGACVEEVRIALGSVAPTPIRWTRAENAIKGLPVDGAVSDDIVAIDDIRSNARYRSKVALNLLKEFTHLVPSRACEEAVRTNCYGTATVREGQQAPRLLDELLLCCGSRKWAEAMASRWLFADINAMLRRADEVWWSLDPEDWLEAFRAHPKIGQRSASKWSQQEQVGAADAPAVELNELEHLNRVYEERFGYIFIICATGKTAGQILDALRTRIENPPDVEIRAAAEEQRQITRLRLLKWHDERS